MRVRAVSAFTDLAEGRVRARGEVFECSPERFGEISEKLPGWVEAVDPEPGDSPEPDLSALTIGQLRSIIAKAGKSAPKKAAKADLLRIAEGL